MGELMNGLINELLCVYFKEKSRNLLALYSTPYRTDIFIFLPFLS